MKRTVVLIKLLIICFTNLLAQSYFIKTTTTIGDQFYVASLPKNGSNTYQRLKIEIMGGNLLNDNMGTRVYTISTRNGNDYTKNLVKISQEQRGGSVSRYALKVYETATGYDFVIETNEVHVAILVQAWLADGAATGITPLTTKEIKKYTNTGGVDVTSQAQFDYIYTTDNNGNIGIGVESPQHKLEVNGTIRSKEVKIEATGWSDFVFEEKYKLPSLSEVEAHIKEKKHLPDIPSEKEVLKDGVNVVEMQAKLLQKIEELTLYVIDQDKQIKELKKQLEE